MIIKELHSEKNNKYATIVLNYNELRDISNGLHDLSKMEVERSSDFHKIHRDMSFLFGLVEHGCIDSFSVEQLTKLQKSIEDAIKNERVD